MFSDDAGEPLWGRHVTTREFGPLLRQAELPPIRFHDLRHTFATLQLAAGTNPKIVSEVLGHKDVGITLDRYSHALPTMQTEAMARLDALLGRSPLDAADDALGEAPQEPELWLDQESGAAAVRAVGGHKGSDKGPNKGPHGDRRAAKRPDPSSDRAEEGEIGTAYRMLVGSSHAAQPGSDSTPWDAWDTWDRSDKGSDKGSGNGDVRRFELSLTSRIPVVGVHHRDEFSVTVQSRLMWRPGRFGPRWQPSSSTGQRERESADQ